MASNFGSQGGGKPALMAGASTNALTVAGGFDDKMADDEADTEEYVPEGFKDVEEYLQDVVKTFNGDAAYDRANREAALDDLKFAAGDQWDPVVKASRLEQGRPCLTVNVLRSFIAQVVGDRRINSTSIKVRPKKDGDVKAAEVRSGLIKSIEDNSKAERVYDLACENQVMCGIGNFRVDLDYAENDVFDQDIFIRAIPNPLAVVWDMMSTDITGRDANHCFVQDTMPRKLYDKAWPDDPCPGEIGDALTTTQVATGWFDKDVVKLTEHWRMIERQRTLALMQDGDVKDITDMEEAQYSEQLFRDPTTGKPRIRKAIVTYAQMHLVTSFAILEGPYELRLSRLPIIKVSGPIVHVGDDRVRFSLIRSAKDPQRLKNYADSVTAETLALAPKAQWAAPADAVEGREEAWRNAHRDGDPLLIFNKNASAPPTRIDPPSWPQGWAMLSQQNQQNIKDTTGLQDASLGVRSNEISGRAIQARQREGDVSTVIFHDNMNSSIEEGGTVVNELIPTAYDSMRIVEVTGVDDKRTLVTINDPNDAESPNLTYGKYGVSIETGPSYTTQRQESADAMMQAIQVAPQLMQVAGDLIVKAQDWPGAQEISERLKKTIPPQLLSDDDPDKQAAQDPNSPQAQQAAAQQQAQQGAMQEQQMALQKQQLEMTQLAAEFQHAEGVRKLEIAQKMADITKAEAEAASAKARVPETEAKAREASAKADQAEHEARHTPARHAQEILHAERAALVKEGDAEHRRKTASAGSRPEGDRGKPATQGKGKAK